MLSWDYDYSLLHNKMDHERSLLCVYIDIFSMVFITQSIKKLFLKHSKWTSKKWKTDDENVDGNFSSITELLKCRQNMI